MTNPLPPTATTPADPAALRATAHHEAGHAVMAHLLGRAVAKVTIAPGRSAFGTERLGVCHLGKGRTRATKDSIEDEVLILMAGMIAEANATGQACTAGAAGDQREITRLLDCRATNQKQFDRLHRRMLDKTEHLMADPVARQAIDWIADDLLARTTISGRTVRHFCKMAQQSAS